MDPPTHYTYMSFMTTGPLFAPIATSTLLGMFFANVGVCLLGVSAHLTTTDAGHHSLHFTSVLKVFDDGS